jgi:uroporphyrinogen-III decarboxylase
MGNINVDLLSRGSREQVVEATKHLIATVSAKGPHILSSGNTIASSVNPENFLAMVETVLHFGTYPIDSSVFSSTD